MKNQSFIGSDLVIEEVEDRWDILETPITGMPKKVRCAYINWRNSPTYGAMLIKSDFKKLKKWCECQIEHFDDNEKEEIK